MLTSRRKGLCTPRERPVHQLDRVEPSTIAELGGKIALSRSHGVELTQGQLRDFVRQRLLNLPALLRDNVVRAKRELLEHVREIVLTPVENTRYAISGNWAMLPDAESVKTMVARDGVEPPTPAFSGLATLKLNSLIRLPLLPVSTTF